MGLDPTRTPNPNPRSTQDEVGNAGFIVQRRPGGTPDFADLESYEKFAPLRSKGADGTSHASHAHATQATHARGHAQHEVAPMQVHTHAAPCEAGGDYVYLDDTVAPGTWVYRILDCDDKGRR
jgi:hypothetical protein